jgi:hypothetical protein
MPTAIYEYTRPATIAAIPSWFFGQMTGRSIETVLVSSGVRRMFIMPVGHGRTALLPMGVVIARTGPWPRLPAIIPIICLIGVAAHGLLPSMAAT